MKYVLGVIGVVLMAIIAIIIIGNRGDNNEQKPGTKPAVNILDYSGNLNSEVSWTQQGRMIGQDQFKSIRIVVSQRERRLEILQGYEETVESVQRFQNSPTAFDNFLRALNLAGFGRERKATITDERGVCPQGNRFLYDLEDGSNHVLHLWSTTCTANQGTFSGNASTVRQLFKDQINDYDKLVQGVRLNGS